MNNEPTNKPSGVPATMFAIVLWSIALGTFILFHGAELAQWFVQVVLR
jgi:hypothetical protein